MAKDQSKKKIADKLPVRRAVEIEPRKILKVGRNQSCPCGSGMKYKDCHESEGEAYLLKLARKREKDKLLEEQREAGVPWYRRLLTRLSE